MAMKKDRMSTIVRVSTIGIAANLLIGTAKAILGLVIGSVALIGDGINNLGDSLSSLVTLVGYGVSRLRPTRKHPLGYGRLEYLSALIVSFLVLYAGLQCLVTSIKRIAEPENPTLSNFAVVMIFVSIIVKIILWRLDTASGMKIDSKALIASGKDSLSDVLASLVALVSVIVSPFTSYPVDGLAGLVVAVIIIISGYSSIVESNSALLGERPDDETVDRIRKIIGKHPPLSGGYDMILHSYGPEMTMGTCNVEVPTIAHGDEIFDAMRGAEREIKAELGIVFTFGLLAVNDFEPEVDEMKKAVFWALHQYSRHILSIHAFHIHHETNMVHFDLVVDYSVKNYKEANAEYTAFLEKTFPNYHFHFMIDPEYD